MTYSGEDFRTDVEWLREQGVYTSEIDEFVYNLIKQGFMMSRKEFVKFVKEVD